MTLIFVLEGVCALGSFAWGSASIAKAEETINLDPQNRFENRFQLFGRQVKKLSCNTRQNPSDNRSNEVSPTEVEFQDVPTKWYIQNKRRPAQLCVYLPVYSVLGWWGFLSDLWFRPLRVVRQLQSEWHRMTSWSISWLAWETHVDIKVSQSRKSRSIDL